MYKVVSLFAGCGGCDRGLIGNFKFNKHKYAKLPYDLVYAMDIDQKALNTHKLNFSGVEVRCEDICKVDASEIPDCDIVIGGFPCQSFSTVNPTKDPFDDRANLYKQTEIHHCGFDFIISCILANDERLNIHILQQSNGNQITVFIMGKYSKKCAKLLKEQDMF